ncbi:MAG: BrnT family toxin [bacterium]
MTLEWDEAKRRTNLQKHTIDFVDAEEIFRGATVTFEDDRISYGEQRWITFGTLKGRVVAVVHTERDVRIRLISIRKATKYEERYYYETITY